MHDIFLRIKSQKLILLMVFVVLAFFVRLYRINNPVADWHAFRQADTASVTREFVKHGIDLLHPKYHDLSNIQSGLDNLEGFRMVEFPLINGLTAVILKTIPVLSLVPTSRLISVIFSIGTLLSLFFLVDALSDRKTAYLTAIVYAFLPFSIYYSRVILPEPAMLFFSCFSLLSFYYWLKNDSWWWYSLSAFSLAGAFLMKPFIVFLAPVYATMIFFYGLKKWQRLWKLIPYGLIAVIPLVWWRSWIEQFPQGIPANSWLYNSDMIRWRPAWFRWLFYERLIKLILGFVGVVFLPLNLLNHKKDIWIYGSWWLGLLAYLSVFATGNVRHDYYQVLLTPIIVISVARGAAFLDTWLKSKLKPKVGTFIVTLILFVSFFLSWQELKGYFNVNHWEYVHAGVVADELLPTDAKVIAPAFGDTMFLFQTNRTGWPIGFEIQDKIDKGATHYLNTSFDDETNLLKTEYTIVRETEDYILLDLTKPKTP